jgi:uncharacterized protein YegP (UPF0339 family)
MPDANHSGEFHLSDIKSEEPGFHFIEYKHKYHFVLKDEEGLLIFSSNPYSTRKAAGQVLRHLRKRPPAGKRFNFHQNEDGFYFILNSGNSNTKTGKSRTFKTVEQARQARDCFLRFLTVEKFRRKPAEPEGSSLTISPAETDPADVRPALKYAYLIEIYTRDENASFRARITNVRTERKLSFSEIDLEVLRDFIAGDVPEFVANLQKEEETAPPPETPPFPTTAVQEPVQMKPPEIPLLTVSPSLDGKRRKIVPVKVPIDLEIGFNDAVGVTADDPMFFDLKLQASNAANAPFSNYMKGVRPKSVNSNSCLIALPRFDVPGFYRIEVNSARHHAKGIGFLQVVPA